MPDGPSADTRWPRGARKGWGAAWAASPARNDSTPTVSTGGPNDEPMAGTSRQAGRGSAVRLITGPASVDEAIATGERAVVQ